MLALGTSTDHYTAIFNNPVRFARTILGEKEIVDRLKALATSPDPSCRERLATT
jgi:hypothetical protein